MPEITVVEILEAAKQFIQDVSADARLRGSVRLHLAQLAQHKLAHLNSKGWHVLAAMHPAFHEQGCIVWGPFEPRNGPAYCLVENLARLHPSIQ